MMPGREEIRGASYWDVMTEPERPKAWTTLLALAKPTLLGRCQEATSYRVYLAERWML